MAPVLKGLVKYAGILNIEIVLDLVKNLIALLKEEKIKGSNSFHCIFACIKLISGTQNVLKLEDKDLTLVLYNAILSPPVDKASQKIMIKALTWLLVEQKQFSYELVAAFLKRMLQVAFHCGLGLMKAFLCLGKQVMGKFSKAYLLMESDENTDGYLFTMNDPYLAQASTSSILPQLELFKHVKDPQVQSLVKSYSNKLPMSHKPLEFLK